MSFYVKIPKCNPLNITLKEYANPDQYRLKHHDDFQFEDTIRYWMQNVQWFQPWQKTDTISLHFIGTIGPIMARLINERDEPVNVYNFSQVAQNANNTDEYIYECNIGLTSINPGYYRLEFDFGNPILLTGVSNWFQVDTIIENTLLVKYKHFKSYAGAYFETGWNPEIRLYGDLVYEKPGSKNVVFEDQENDMTLVDSKPYSIFRLYVGGPEGVPNNIIELYNFIIGCQSLLIDGKYYTRATDGAAFEESEEKDYPMRGWSIELRDKLNRNSKIFQYAGGSPGVNDTGLTVVIAVENKGFVDGDTGGSFSEIYDIE